MPFKLKINEAFEIYKDPIGHYHHWTILNGHVIEGTIHQGDLMSIPAVDGTRLCTRVLGFERYAKRLGSEVSAGQYPDPIGIATWHPAPSKTEIAYDIATELSLEAFHELALFTLRNKPSRFIHDRGPEGRADGRERSCGDCLGFLYKEGPVLHPDFASVIRDLEDSPDPYIARRAKEIISKSLTEEEFSQRHAAERAAREAKIEYPFWMFWKRR